MRITHEPIVINAVLGSHVGPHNQRAGLIIFEIDRNEIA